MGSNKSATLIYFDNGNAVPAPYGVPVLFNQEQQDIWLGYDPATGDLCVTNYNRTVILGCYTMGGAPLMFGMHNALGGIVFSFAAINAGAFIPIQPSILPNSQANEADANYLLNNGTGGRFRRLGVRAFSNTCNQDVLIILRKNGVDTGLKVVIPALFQGDKFDDVNEVVAADSDLFCLELRPDSTALGFGTMQINNYQLWLF
jgi:hypothetical protein